MYQRLQRSWVAVNVRVAFECKRLVQKACSAFRPSTARCTLTVLHHFQGTVILEVFYLDTGDTHSPVQRDSKLDLGDGLVESLHTRVSDTES